MTKVHTGLLNMDKSTFGVSRKGVSFRTTRHNVNRRVQTNDLIISGLGEREEKKKVFFFPIKQDSFIRRSEWGAVSLNSFVLSSV